MVFDVFNHLMKKPENKIGNLFNWSALFCVESGMWQEDEVIILLQECHRVWLRVKTWTESARGEHWQVPKRVVP